MSPYVAHSRANAVLLLANHGFDWLFLLAVTSEVGGPAAQMDGAEPAYSFVSNHSESHVSSRALPSLDSPRKTPKMRRF